ncbi:50S ribosomal protein L25/general stress protein Ctc [Scardovia wiggsiae]
MADITLNGEVRDEFGKGAARRMRVAGLIPASIYEGGRQPVFVKLPQKEATLAMRRANALIEIKFGKETRLAVAREIQRNPVSRNIEHIDFYEVHAGEKVEVEVPVFVEGTPKGAAVAFVDIQNLTMRADVSNLPENITLSVEGMVEGDHIFAKDIKLPKGAELVLDNLEESVVSVTVPAEEAAVPAGDTETAGETPAAESDSSESAE